jgi:hypothetical protein
MQMTIEEKAAYLSPRARICLENSGAISRPGRVYRTGQKRQSRRHMQRMFAVTLVSLAMAAIVVLMVLAAGAR